MNRVLAGIASVSLAASLGACVYYPHGPYGPGYGPPPPAYGPPPPGYGGPPAGADYGAPPGQQPPAGYQEGAPPQGADGPPGAGQQGPTPAEIRKMNDPNWCAAHPHRCAKLRAEYGGGPPPQGSAPQGSAPPPGQYQGPPPGQQ